MLAPPAQQNKSKSLGLLFISCNLPPSLTRAKPSCRVLCDMMIRLAALRIGREAHLDFVDGRRRERPTVHANVATLAIARQAAVTVTVQVDRAVVRAVPDAHSVMAEGDRYAVNGHIQKTVNGGPPLRRLHPVAVVVVAENEPLLAVEARQIGGVIGKGEVAKVIDHIATRHDGVPAPDHLLIHFFDGRERAMRKVNDALVAEMMVRCKPD